MFQNFPSVIFEVLSDSTLRTDESEKRDASLSIPGLTHDVMLGQTVADAIVYERGSNEFNRRAVTGLSGILSFPEVKVDLSLAAVYDRVVFECSAAEEMMLIPLEVFGRICDYRA